MSHRKGKISLFGFFFLVYISCIFLFFPQNLVFAQSESKEGYKEGYEAGEDVGNFYGEKDRQNEKKSDWRTSYKKEKQYIDDDYDLRSYTSSYRRDFYQGFEEGFRDAYKKAYKREDTDKNYSDTDRGLSDGKSMGDLLGKIQGTKDAREGKSNNWERKVFTKKQIEYRYELGQDSKEYSRNFVQGFLEAYELAYVTAYRKMKVENASLSIQQAYEHGMSLGTQAGTLWGQRHWEEKEFYDWEWALQLYEKEIPLNQRYYLNLELEEYQVEFINGFHVGFRNAYRDVFQKNHVTYGTENMNYYWINQKDVEIQLEDTIVHILKGEPVEETQTIAKLFVPTHAFWGKFYLGISKDRSDIYTLYSPYRTLSDSIYIRVSNKNTTIKNVKPLKLSFPWYGEERAGIYELKNNQWRYIYSVMENETITASIWLDKNLEGHYMVMVDDNYKEISDLYGHWAQKELYTFLRRGYIKGNDKRLYHPDQTMTRGDFLLLLSKMQNWSSYSKNNNLFNFLDQDTFGEYANVIQYATLQGYVSGYADNHFRPYQAITYQEIEWILKKVLKKSDFQWEVIAEKLKYEKFTQSKSRYGKNQSIPKGEIIFALYVLQEKGLL